MSLNIEDEGFQIARIIDDPDYKDITFSISDKTLPNSFNSYHIKDDGIFQIIPNEKADRSSLFIAGSEGAGKSVFIYKWLLEYLRAFPKNKIYLFSEKEKDILDDVKGLKRVDYTDIGTLDYNEFQSCCVVFDDTDAFNKDIRKPIEHLRDKLLKNARANKVTVLTSAHSFGGDDLKATLINCKIIVFFLNDLNRSLKYMINNYIGLDKDQIDILKSNKSRWTAYIKTFPNVIVQEKDIMSLEGLQSF